MAGCRIVRDNRAAVKAKVAAIGEKTLDEVVKAAIAEMKSAAPEKSGSLRRQITGRRLSRFRRRLRSGAKHSAIIEFGTHATPARPFFYPAFWRARNELIRRLRLRLKRV